MQWSCAEIWTKSTAISIVRRSSFTVIYDLYVVWQHDVLCEVKLWRFVALFK